MTFHGMSHWLIRAFGRYAGYGNKSLEIQSRADLKLRGRDGNRLSYNDLIPGATRILEQSERIRSMISSRWSIVICDEAQDTSSEQWQLIEMINVKKVLMLGDFNQMIYSSFVPGVSKRQFETIRNAVNLEVTLRIRSYRDPSGLIPSVADAVLRRDFRNDAVLEAIRAERLYVYFDTNDEERLRIISSEIDRARKMEMTDVGIFSGSNNAVSELAEQLHAKEIDHTLVGIPEAHAQALNAMAIQCGYATGLMSESELRESFALFATASVRSRNVPDMALALVGSGTLPDTIEIRIVELLTALREAADTTVGDVAEIAMRSWYGLGFTFGFKPWRRASQHFARMVLSD